jgi:hypothetical protein
MNEIEAQKAIKELAVLKDGDKITMVVENSFGLTVVRHARYKKHKVAKYAQYPFCLSIWYILKGKRNVTGNAYPTSQLAIGLGWQDITDQNSGNFECFDGKSFTSVFSHLQNVVYCKVGN